MKNVRTARCGRNGIFVNLLSRREEEEELKKEKRNDQDERSVHELRRAMFVSVYFSWVYVLAATNRGIRRSPPRTRDHDGRFRGNNIVRWPRGDVGDRVFLGVGPRHAPGIRVDQTETLRSFVLGTRLRVSPSRRQS